MHSYQPQWPQDYSDWEPPSPADFVYHDAHDVARYAMYEPLTTWHTWPEVWHLDRDGRWQCCSKGSTLDSIERLAGAPEHMLDCRATPIGQPCPDYWAVLEPRHRWRDRYEVTEADARAFVVLRHGLATFGVTLLDFIVFNQEYHWWSLHELTSGTTAWDFREPAIEGCSPTRALRTTSPAPLAQEASRRRREGRGHR